MNSRPRVDLAAAIALTALIANACSREPEPLPQQGALPPPDHANLAAAALYDPALNSTSTSTLPI